LTFAEPQAWPGQPQIDFGAPFAGFTFGSDDPRYRRDNWKLSFVTQLAGKTVNPNSRLQVTLDSSPQATRSASPCVRVVAASIESETWGR